MHTDHGAHLTAQSDLRPFRDGVQQPDALTDDVSRAIVARQRVRRVAVPGPAVHEGHRLSLEDTHDDEEPK